MLESERIMFVNPETIAESGEIRAQRPPTPEGVAIEIAEHFERVIMGDKASHSATFVVSEECDTNQRASFDHLMNLMDLRPPYESASIEEAARNSSKLATMLEPLEISLGAAKSEISKKRQDLIDTQKLEIRMTAASLMIDGLAKDTEYIEDGTQSKYSRSSRSRQLLDEFAQIVREPSGRDEIIEETKNLTGRQNESDMSILVDLANCVFDEVKPQLTEEDKAKFRDVLAALNGLRQPGFYKANDPFIRESIQLHVDNILEEQPDVVELRESIASLHKAMSQIVDVAPPNVIIFEHEKNPNVRVEVDVMSAYGCDKPHTIRVCLVNSEVIETELADKEELITL